MHYTNFNRSGLRGIISYNLTIENLLSNRNKPLTIVSALYKGSLIEVRESIIVENPQAQILTVIITV